MNTLRYSYLQVLKLTTRQQGGLDGPAAIRTRAMIKERSGNLLILGLSHESLRRLKEGRPMTIDLRGMGEFARAFVFAGETEAQLQELRREFIESSTGRK